MFPSNSKSNTHQVSPTSPPKHELNKDATNKCTKRDGESPQGLNPTQRATGNRGKLGGSQRDGLLQRRTHQFVFQCQMVSLENIHTVSKLQIRKSNLNLSKEIVFEICFTCMCIYAPRACRACGGHRKSRIPWRWSHGPL